MAAPPEGGVTAKLLMGRNLPSPQQAMTALDKDKDGFLSEEEFLASPLAQNKEVGRQLFKRFDTNHDGKISLPELRAAFAKIRARAQAAREPGDTEVTGSAGMGSRAVPGPMGGFGMGGGMGPSIATGPGQRGGPVSGVRPLKIVSLQYVRSDEVVQVLRQLYDFPKGEMGAKDGSIRVAEDRRTGRLLFLTGQPEKVSQAVEIIQALDVRGPGTERQRFGRGPMGGPGRVGMGPQGLSRGPMGRPGIGPQGIGRGPMAGRGGPGMGPQGFARPPMGPPGFGRQGFGRGPMGRPGMGNQGFGGRGMGRQGFGRPPIVGRGRPGMGPQGLGRGPMGRPGMGYHGFGHQPFGRVPMGQPRMGPRRFGRSGISYQGFGRQGFGHGHFRMVYLRYVRGDDVMRVLRELLDIPEGEMGAKDGSIRIAEGGRTGQLLFLTGQPAKISRAADIIERLDVRQGHAVFAAGTPGPQGPGPGGRPVPWNSGDDF